MHLSTVLGILAMALLAGCQTGPRYKIQGASISEDEAQRLAIERTLQAQVKQPLDQPLRLVRFQLPPYPDELRRMNAQGKVRVRFRAGPGGEVKDAAIVGSPNPYLAATVLASLLNWRFEPITRNGEPAAVPLVYEFVFRLE